MCNPALIAAGVMVVSSIAGGAAKKKAAKAEAAEMEYQAAAGREAAKEEAKLIRKAGSSARSTAKTQLAASGVDVNAGTAAQIQDQITADSEGDAFISILNGGRRADQLNRSAQYTRMGGEQAMQASVIQGAGQAAGAYSGWKA